MKRKNLVIILVLVLFFIVFGFMVPLTAPRYSTPCDNKKTHFAILRGEKKDFEKLYSSEGEADRQDKGCTGLAEGQTKFFVESRLYLL